MKLDICRHCFDVRVKCNWFMFSVGEIIKFEAIPETMAITTRNGNYSFAMSWLYWYVALKIFMPSSSPVQ